MNYLNFYKYLINSKFNNFLFIIYYNISIFYIYYFKKKFVLLIS
jgi:hypothetical protein